MGAPRCSPEASLLTVPWLQPSSPSLSTEGVPIRKLASLSLAFEASDGEKGPGLAGERLGLMFQHFANQHETLSKFL